ncbi:MAG: hypothetical protein HQK51_03005 [Oligoflexia bacterium]|nr:hypothetical protein [Oligoflexia bacterium]
MLISIKNIFSSTKNILLNNSKDTIPNFTYATLNLNSSDYRQVIAPKLKIIINDFIIALRQIHPYSEEVVKNFHSIHELNNLLYQWRISCYRTDIYNYYSCEDILEKFYLKFRDVEALMFKLHIKTINDINSIKFHKLTSSVALATSTTSISDNSDSSASYNKYENYDFNQKNFESINTFIKISEGVDEILFKVLKLSNVILYDQRSMSQHKKCFMMRHISEIEKDLWEMNLISERLIFNGISYLNGMDIDFLTVWNSFVRVLYKDILPFDNYVLLVKRIEDLNFSWNIFYKKMSREGKVYSRELMNPLISIDDQINAILRSLMEKK